MIRQRLPDASDELLKDIPGHGHRGGAGDDEDGELIEAFSHLVLGVTDLDRSEPFYRDVLGLDLVGRNITAETKPHSVFRTNRGHLLILVQNETVKPARKGSQATHHAFALTPNQWRRARERLEAMGYETSDLRQQFRALGDYNMDVTDPDGHRFQIEAHGPEAHEIVLPDAGIVDCGPAADYALGEVKPFKDGNFFLVRLAEGFLAMPRWCTHMNGTPVYQPTYYQFRCPQHGKTFDRRGDPIGLQSQDVPGLRLNPITFSPEGHVLVNTDVVIQRDRFVPGQLARPPR